MNVQKRNGKSEPLNIEKIHKVLEWACDSIKNVSMSQIELSANLQFKSGMKTSDIHEILIKSAADLISERYPNYQYVAARLLLMQNRKSVQGQFDPVPLNETIKKNIKKGHYENIYEYFTETEVDYFDSKINYQRDYTFTYAGLRTCFDKYAIKDKGQPVEIPQQLNMLVAMMIYKSDKTKIVRYYDSLSKFKVSLPSPIMSGLRTPIKGYASCCLIDMGDSKDSITSASSATVVMTTIRAGIGLSASAIRALNSYVGNTSVKHGGIVPILSLFEAAVKAFQQPNRGGSATTYIPFWSLEIEKVLTLKSNKSTDENSVRKLDYGILMNELLFERAKNNETITLFSAHETRGLEVMNDYEMWVQNYLKLEKKTGIMKKKIKARAMLESFVTEAFETGRYYPMFMDNANTNNPLKDTIKMSNLCSEIFLPVKPLKYLEDPEGEIALCILTNINAGRVQIDEMPNLAELVVGALDNLIDIQEYPLPAAENPTKNARYLGIGVSDWAHKLTKDKVRYNTKEAQDIAEEYMEHWQFNLLKASMNIAKEKGEAPWFREKSKYAQGWLPNQGKQRFIPKKEWDKLSKDIQKYGLRNLTLSAIPPAGTSSDLSNSTSGIDMPRDFLVTKKSKSGPVKQIVPNFSKGSSYYTLAYDENFDNIAYIDMISKFQLYVDQGISMNLYFSPKDMVEDKIPMGTLTRTYRHAHRAGLKSVYYCNFDDEDIAKNDNGEESCPDGGCSV